MTHLLIAHGCVRLKEGSMFILEKNTPDSTHSRAGLPGLTSQFQRLLACHLEKIAFGFLLEFRRL